MHHAHALIGYSLSVKHRDISIDNEFSVGRNCIFKLFNFR